MGKKDNDKKAMIKIVYFDEPSASDYNIIKEGGKIDWTTEKNKEKLAKIVGEIEAQAKAGFNLFSYIKSSISGKTSISTDIGTSSLVNSTVTNTILTDYIDNANKDSQIKKFHNHKLVTPQNSVTMYRMYSSYLNIVPQDQIPISIEGLNNAILGERGYYQMLAYDNGNTQSQSVLRFNINAFKNSYTLVDLTKMDLSYYAVKVGKTTLEKLSLEKEFDLEAPESRIDIEEIVTEEKQEISQDNYLDVYDVVLAGVMSNE
ncbi:DUF6414 family protein [Streptococcus caviae]|uniref:DUF6414 family protein n=1 Tax=Streptococcus sp. 'caviae' TaxID=1915004 RepID=UPI00094B7B9D|nr:DUF6414 family protein [Streptococcus sp. 'caviae']OLN82997.1 hypothetical protein BMI76_06990 [Streptococcus sp. 'caviae']